MLVLDTNVCIGVLRGRDASIATRYQEIDPATVLIPAIVAGELMVGALKSVRTNAVEEVETFLSAHEIVPFGEPEFRVYARVRADLESRGLKIGGNDMIIAATVLASGATLVTHNTGEFARVQGLSLTDWQS